MCEGSKKIVYKTVYRLVKKSARVKYGWKENIIIICKKQWIFNQIITVITTVSGVCDNILFNKLTVPEN